MEKQTRIEKDEQGWKRMNKRWNIHQKVEKCGKSKLRGEMVYQYMIREV